MNITQAFINTPILSVSLFLATMSIPDVLAQDKAAKTVIAVTNEGNKLKAPSSFHVALFPLDLFPHKFKICVENRVEEYLKIELVDSRGNKMHKLVFIYDRNGIIKYDMSQMPAGDYTVKIYNTLESKEFELKLTNRVTPVIEIRNNILAKHHLPL